LQLSKSFHCLYNTFLCFPSAPLPESTHNILLTQTSADEWASMSGRKTISPNDVYNALKEYEYQAFLPRVQAEVAKYNEVQCDKRNSYRKRVKADKAAVDPEDGKDTDAMDDTDAAISNAVANGKRSGEDEPPSKKIRREPGDEAHDGDEDVEGEGPDDEPEEDEDEEEEDDGEEPEAEEEAEDDEPADEGMQEDDDDLVSGEIRDEALDEPDSD